MVCLILRVVGDGIDSITTVVAKIGTVEVPAMLELVHKDKHL